MRSIRYPKLTFALLLLSAFVLWLAAVQIMRYARFSALEPVAYRLATGVPTNATDIRALVPLAESVRDERICQSDFVKSSYAILLAALDLENEDRDYAEWAAALGRAEAFGRHALGCSPTSGSFWLKLAMLHKAEGEQPGELLTLIGNSQLYAPAEIEVLGGRYALYNRLTDTSITVLAPVIDRDIEVICSQQADGMRRELAPPSQSVARVLAKLAPQCAIPFRPI